MQSMNENKRIIEHVYAELARGNSRPFVDALAHDVRWSMIGSTAWSGVYEGKETVLKTLLAPLRAQFAGQYTARAERLIAEGDLVVAEVRGRVGTTRGRRYDNTYCFIFRLVEGKISEMTEYLDTALVDAELAPPAQR
jgi:ketosteroid isomerase-like protein